MPTLDAQVEALALAFVELSKFLGRKQLILVTQLATAIENAATASQASAETTAAVVELARRLR